MMMLTDFIDFREMVTAVPKNCRCLRINSECNKDENKMHEIVQGLMIIKND